MKEQSYYLHRSELINELQNIGQYPSTIVAAPMGYGKSTAVLSFLESQNTNWILISFDGIIHTAEQAWNMFSMQLQKDYPLLGNQLYNLGYPKDYAQFENAIEIFEGHCIEDEMTVVFDDFHNMQAVEFNETMQQMIMRRIPGLHFLFVTRKIPDFRLEELLLKNYCYVIDSVSFELTPMQIIDYFLMFNIHLSASEVGEIYKISEGWISAVCLIQRLYTQTGQIIKENGIENMLIASSKSLFSEAELQILIPLSFLDSFTLPLALYIINDPNIEQILTRMCFHNLFIRFDSHNKTYRIHNILRSYLKKHTATLQHAISEVDVCKKAGTWYLEAGNLVQALLYYLKAKDYNSVLKEFEKQEMTDYYDRIPEVIMDIFDSIPVLERYKNPIAYLSFIGFYVTNVAVEPGFLMLFEAETYFNQNIAENDLSKQIKGEIELIRAYINFNDLNLMRVNLSNAYSILKGPSLIANPKKIPTFGSPQALYLYFRSSMEIFDTVEQMALTYPFYYNLSGGCGDGFIHQARAEACLETGDLECAERFAKKAIYSISEGSQLSVLICSYFTLARYYIAHGEKHKAKQILEAQKDNVWNSGPPMLIHGYEVAAAYIDCILNDADTLPKWITTGDLSESDILYQGLGFGYIVYGKYLLLTKDYLRLEVLCEKMQNAYSQFKNEIGFLHMYLLQSIAKYNLYGVKKAIPTFKTAIETGHRNNIILLFAEYGSDILHLLNDIDLQKQLSPNAASTPESLNEYIHRIHSLAIAYDTSSAKDSKNIISDLTARESETLMLVCKGKTNREIANELSIAEITVRKNLTSIYRKLEVPNRASAIRKMLNDTL